MRTIRKSSPPRALTEWIERNKNDENFGYKLLRGNANKWGDDERTVAEIVTESLLVEQGRICAYTGIRLTGVKSCHIEHLIPQSHCHGAFQGWDVAYTNLVACYPAPNDPKGAPFGAHAKGDWPNPHLGEDSLFVSPLSANCASRFLFNFQGEISALPGDDAAAQTIIQLNLNHKPKSGEFGLTGRRRAAIEATLQQRRLSLADARRRLQALEKREREGGTLEEFCFVLQQVLKRYIDRLEAKRAGIEKQRAPGKG